MRLINFENYVNIEVVRDIEFENLGLNVSSPNQKIITFIDDEKYLYNLSKSVVGIITTEKIAGKIDQKYGLAISKNPRIEYFKILNIINKSILEKKYESKIGENCIISNLAHIDKHNVTIGSNVTIEEFVVIKENTKIGNNVIIRSGSKIGNEGFEYKVLESTIMDVVHAGEVVIKDNVEIKNNVCIDKAVYSWDSTLIGEYSKIDNLVYLAHGVKVEEQCLITGGCVVGGRVKIGKKSRIGLGAKIANGLTIGEESKIRLGAVVTTNLEANSDVSGNFAINHKKNIENIKKIR